METTGFKTWEAPTAGPRRTATHGQVRSGSNCRMTQEPTSRVMILPTKVAELPWKRLPVTSPRSDLLLSTL